MAWWRRDPVIFLTHSAGEWCEPGHLHTDRDGVVYKITQVRPTSPTRLFAGGASPCWEVRGRVT